jgi:hypothetical protein
LTIGSDTLHRRDGLGIWETGGFTILAKEEAEFIVIEVPVNN